MKKLLCILCLLLALVCVFVACDTETPNTDNNNDKTEQNGGNETENNGDENNQTSHTHAYGEWSVSKAATCTAKGEEKRTCACGESEMREIAMLSHTYGEWSTSKAATCTAKGEEKRTCSCGASETREIAATGEHTYGEWSVTTVATCGAKGEEKHTCSCGASETREIAATGEHTYGDWSVTIVATCGTKGEEKRACSCGASEAREVAATGKHIYGEWKVTTAATCVNKGEEKRTCACGESETREIVATGEHTYGTDNKCTGCQLQLVYTEGLEYVLNSDGESYTVKKGTALNNTTDVVIPYYYNEMPVITIGAQGFSNTALTSIQIPSSVTRIGEQAFSHCSNLKSVNIPLSITSIGYGAFASCTELDQEENGVVYVDKWAVLGYGMSELYNTITLRADTVGIADEAFMYNYELLSITIPPSVTKIGKSAFRECRSLQSVHITDIAVWCNIEFDDGFANPLLYAEHLYLNDREITGTLTIPQGVNKIGAFAFHSCQQITNINIPASVTDIGSGAFIHCTALTSITVDTSNAKYSSVDGVLYNKNDGVLIHYPAKKSATSFSIPDSVTSIGDYAFQSCTNLAKITISTNVTNLGNAAFRGCTALTSIHIPASVTSIGTAAFNGCQNLSNVTFEKNSCLTNIGRLAFNECTRLISITIPPSVASIGGDAFERCEKLIEVYNLSGLAITATSYGLSAKNIYTATTGESKLFTENDYVFYDDGTTRYLMGYTGTATELSLPANCRDNSYAIYQYAFYRRDDITKIILSANTTGVGKYAFDHCTALTSINVPKNVTVVGERAFAYCTALTEINFDAAAMNDLSGNDDIFYYSGKSAKGITVNIGVNVIKIPAYFIEYTNVINVIFVENSQCQSIGEYAFANCKNLTGITIPASITRIGRDAFMCCYKLIEVYNLSSLEIKTNSYGLSAKKIYTAIPNENKFYVENDYIFYDDGTDRYLMSYTGTLTELTLPEDFRGNTYEIYQYAFSQNRVITNVAIPASVTSIGNYAFSDCTALATVAFGENSQLTSIGNYAFMYCTSLTSINIPASVASIGSSAFSQCTSLTSIEIPASVTSIGSSAFFYCTSLTSIEIPASVTSIGEGAFSDCTSLTSVTFAETSGWWYSSSSTATSGTSISATDLAKPAKAAEYLTDDYCWYYWNRTVE